MERFDTFAREILKNTPQPISFPDEGTVFDYLVDKSTGSFVPWSTKPGEKQRVVHPAFTLTPQVLTNVLIAVQKYSKEKSCSFSNPHGVCFGQT